MQAEALWKELSRYYHGFYIEEPVGNNAFSFEARRHQRLYVPALVEGDLNSVTTGQEVVFSEVFEGEERNCYGLKNFVYWPRQGKDIFIFDNHHHAFAFWSFGMMTEKISSGSALVHVDQHKDLRHPDRYLDKEFWKHSTLTKICSYANRELNVGNFVDPALKARMFRELILVDHQQAFSQIPEGKSVADIDLDIFSPEMEYIPLSDKISFIRELITRSSFVTIATSPYFIEQGKALEILKEIF